MHIHLIGVCGTGMGSLAGLLKDAGHRVTGSDTAFYPPMGDALQRWGIETRQGFSADHLEPAPDFVVVGNVCRKDNPEARAAIDGGMRYDSMPGALASMFLETRDSYVIAGTHGKTTTTTLTTFLLDRCGYAPGYLIGGVPADFETSFRAGEKTGPFVIEGDEYDSAFFEKTPKFWRYHPKAVVLTSVEHDHIDIYPDEASYLAAFEGLIERIDPDGVLIAWAGDSRIRALAEKAPCRVSYFAVQGDDCGDVSPVWFGAPLKAQGGLQPFDLFVGGSAGGTVFSPLFGTHNVRNALAAIAICAERAGAPLSTLTGALRSFGGIKRRQEWVGEAGGVHVYDDFAHHPTAVAETLRGMRAKHPESKIIAIFEPRSATASRNLHQAEYAPALASADRVLLAPVGRPEIPDEERLDTHAIAQTLSSGGVPAEAAPSVDSIIETVSREAEPGDVVVVMSNGAFGGIHGRLLVALSTSAHPNLPVSTHDA